MSDITREDFENFTPEQMNHYATHGTKLEPQSAPEIEAPKEVEKEAQEEPPAQVEPKKGNPDVPLKALREQVRQLTQERDTHAQNASHRAKELEDFTNAQRFREQQAQQQRQLPQTAIEDQNVIAAHVQHHVNNALGAYHQQAVAPLQAHLAQQQALNAQMAHNAELSDLRSRFPGEPVDDHIAHFDKNQPQLANQRSPEEKFLLVRGARALDPRNPPSYSDEDVKANAQKMAEDALRGAANGKAIPITMGGIPVSKNTKPEPNPSDYSDKDMHDMSLSELQALRSRWAKVNA